MYFVWFDTNIKAEFFFHISEESEEKVSDGACSEVIDTFSDNVNIFIIYYESKIHIT